MTNEFRLTVEQTSEIAALELQNDIDEQASGTLSVERTEPDLAPGTVGDPGLLNLVISYAPDTVPVLIGVLAAWITAGRRRTTGRAKRIEISRRGVSIARIEFSQLERASSTDALRTVLGTFLRSPHGGRPEE